MKPMWIVLFGVLAAAFIALFALGVYATITDEDTDPPDVAARKAECRKLERHLFDILPEGSGKSPDDVIPIEDIDLCSAAYPEAVTCMEAAHDMAGVSACFPVTVECEQAATVVEGARPIYEVVGKCDAITVKTGHAFVAIRAGKRIELAGDDNLIRVYLGKDDPKPALVDHGARNRVEYDIKK